MQAVGLLWVNPVYWFNLVIFERRYSLALLLISLTGLLCKAFSSLSSLWLLSGLLSGLPYGLPYAVPFPPISHPLPFPLVYRRYRYAIRHTL